MTLIKPLQAIILDIDGTTLDTAHAQHVWLKKAAEQFGGVQDVPLFDDAWRDAYNAAYEKAGMKGLYNLIKVDFDAHNTEIWRKYNEFNRTHPIIPVEGMAEAIREVYNRGRVSQNRSVALRIAANTTKSWAAIETPLQRAGLIPLFDTVVTKDDIYDHATNGAAKRLRIDLDDLTALRTIVGEDTIKELEKPNGYASWLTVQRLGVEHQAVIAFEDTATGILSYKGVRLPHRRTDIHVVGVTWGFDTKENLRAAGADTILEKPKEIVQYIGDKGGFS
jgi:beta-phosphoglucomutase-like phosphatase (HAD superfamily)